MACVTLVAGAVVVTTVAASPARAFDCKGAPSCPFVKVENMRQGDEGDPHSLMVHYNVSATLEDASGTPVHQWSEDDPVFTLWHWRYFGGGGNVRIHIYAWSTDPTSKLSADADFTTPASVPLCIKVDEAGVYQADGCTDFEDPAH